MFQKELKTLSIDDIHPYARNPRNNADAVEAVMASIRQCKYVAPIIVDENGEILAGHTRFEALKRMGEKEIEVLAVSGLSNEQKRKYRLLDNKTSEFAEWDFDLLAEELDDLDFDDFDFDFGIFDDELYSVKQNYQVGKASGGLSKRFGVPPFSILDAKQGAWQERKRSWLEITGDLSETRDDEFGTIGGGTSKNLLSQINNRTSNFDPVLAELMMKWFCIEGGHILDPFGGEQTKGVVAGELGYKYTGIEIRQEQVDLNREKTKQYKDVQYICVNTEDM